MYIAATPAKISVIRHGSDNIVRGIITTDKGTCQFQTRKHVIHAVNRIYKNVDWKASIGENILIDGDHGKDLIIDHIEPLPMSYSPIPHYLNEYKDRILTVIKSGPDLTSTYRKSNPSEGFVYIRWNKPIKIKNNRGKLEDGILHGRISENNLKLAVAMKKGGKYMPLNKATHLLQVIAPSIGIPFLDLKPEKAPATRQKELSAGRKYKHWSPLPDIRPKSSIDHFKNIASKSVKTKVEDDYLDDVPF